MFAYLSLLVELGWFEQVYVHFLPPGHTHSNLDQKYSVISQALKNKDVFTLDHLITEVGGVFQSMGDYTKQEVVTSIGDFSAVLKDNVYQLFPLSKSVPFKDAPKIRIQELQNIEVHWKSILDVISPKDAAEDIADDLSGPDDLAVRDYGCPGLKDILTMETELARPPTADLLYLHSSQGTKPDTRAAYDPNTDLALGHVAVVKVAVEDSSGERGWDVVDIKSDTVIGEVECVYLMPLYSKRGEALVYTDTDYPQWPSEWMDQKLVPITVKLGRNHKATWTGNIPLDAVQFSCQPTSNMKIPKKYHTSVLLACKAIEDNTRPEAVQSDGDNVDIDGEEEEVEEGLGG
eukprot:gene19825-biopygen28670